jgi:AraC-like DNA-binding protein
MRLTGFNLGRLNVSTVTYGTPGVAQLLQERDCWVFATVKRGGTAVGREVAGVGDVGALAPDSLRVIPMSSDLKLVNLRVATADLNAACCALLGRESAHPLQFPAHIRANATPAHTLNSLLLRLAAVPTYHHASAPALERRLQEAALFELLMTWPHLHSQALAAPAALPRSVQIARDFIHAHVQEQPTLGDIAAAAGVGVRALARGFEKWMGVSPMRYAVQCRLDAARAELQDRGDATNVTHTALRWGFTNLGDFAASYRLRFGELPSKTLRVGRMQEDFRRE